MYKAKGREVITVGGHFAGDIEAECETEELARETAEILNNQDTMHEVFSTHLRYMDTQFKKVFANWTEKCTEWVVYQMITSGSYYGGDTQELPEVGLRKKGELYRKA